jgi:hypothetical protein
MTVELAIGVCVGLLPIVGCGVLGMAIGLCVLAASRP